MSKTALSAHDRRTYRRQLLDLTARLSGGVAELVDESSRPTGSEETLAVSSTDGAVSTASESDEEVARNVLLSEAQILAEAQAALMRLDAGTFGRCEQCGATITKSRLNALPYARLCIHCSRAGGNGDEE